MSQLFEEHHRPNKLVMSGVHLDIRWFNTASQAGQCLSKPHAAPLGCFMPWTVFAYREGSSVSPIFRFFAVINIMMLSWQEPATNLKVKEKHLTPVLVGFAGNLMVLLRCYYSIRREGAGTHHISHRWTENG